MVTGKNNNISIVIPIFNEAKNIEDLIKRIHEVLTNKDIHYELIFIDDHSTDKSAEILQIAAKTYPIRLFTKKGKQGKAYSLLEGFSYAKYDSIVMIDADLQYPPEAIPDMLHKLDEGYGVVVANRKKHNTGFIRKLVSKSFLFLFGKLLHQLDCDVQSGLKLFKKEIIERIPLNPRGQWSFDLEFLVKAKNAGYSIGTVDIVFEERKKELPKIHLIPASIEIGKSAIRLWLRRKDIVPFHPAYELKKGKGFHYKGVEFVHYSNLNFRETAFRTLNRHHKIILSVILAVFVAGLILNWYITLITFVAMITVLYFLDLFFNLFLITRNFSSVPEMQVSEEELKKLKGETLPKYTILCPLYREWEVLPQFVKAMSNLDYPKDKLQVILLLEEDDQETLKHAQEIKMPDYFETVIVPHSLPKTKPKALNYGLRMASGEYIVVYDAEDIPDKNQLKKAIIAFKKVGPRTACIQAKLNFYNPHQNILTRVFTAEYSLWFDLVLTGLQSISAPIPLGGTSNHFKVSMIKELKGWDSFNVTEDCDLGMRLAKRGYLTALIQSVTLEEANSDIQNWFQQRTRWIKGYLQTYFVHMRKPKEFMQTWKEPHLFTFQLVVGGKVLSMFINPFLWLTTILYFTFRSTFGVFISQFFPAPVLYMGVFSLVFGNFLYMYYYMIGCAKRGHYKLIKYVFLVPFYWLAMSVAAWKALFQLMRRPHFWPKTIHGFHIDREKALMQSFEYVGNRLAYQNVLNPLEQPKKHIYFNERLRFFIRNIKDFIDVFRYKSKVIDNKGLNKKILIFNWRDTKHSFAGGAEVYVHELAKRWVKSGCDVTLFCGNDGLCARQEVIDGVEIVRRGGFYFVYVWAMLYYLLKFRGRYDVIIDCENGIPFFTPLFAKEKIFLLIHHVHQEVFLRSLKAPLSWLAIFLETKLMPFVYRNIQLITVSPSSKKEILAYKLTNKEPHVIYNGVDLVRFKPGKKHANPLILYLGRLKYYKSLNIFIKSAYEVLKKVPHAEFVIAGEGEEKAGLVRLANKLGLENKIKFLGKVNEEEKIRLYQKAWVFVNPSFMEGWGITSIEANACGTPVVASDVPGLRDSVRNPTTGYLVEYGKVKDFAEKITELIENKKLRQEFSRDALVWAQDFDWKKSANDSLEIIFFNKTYEK